MEVGFESDSGTRPSRMTRSAECVEGVSSGNSNSEPTLQPKTRYPYTYESARRLLLVALHAGQASIWRLRRSFAAHRAIAFINPRRVLRRPVSETGRRSRAPDNWAATSRRLR